MQKQNREEVIQVITVFMNRDEGRHNGIEGIRKSFLTTASPD